MIAGGTRCALELRDVSKQIGGVAVLDRVSLCVERGRRHALVGPNGSGKTTLLRILAGRVIADAGEVRYWGVKRGSSAGPADIRVRYLTQHFSLYGELTVRENLRFLAAMHGVCAPARAVEGAMEDFDLFGYRDSRAQTLSGGVRQRLMLASALLGNPSLLLLDEPTAALDDRARSHLWHVLDAKRTVETTLIVTTHLAQDLTHCDVVSQCLEGRIERTSEIARPTNEVDSLSITP
jgi:ABC-2 type transport system ATP-binding protein